jgi:hypothetical protein
VVSGAHEFRVCSTGGKERKLHFRYEDLRKVEAVDRELRINDAALLCQSPQHASYYARLVEKLRNLEEDQREQWIRSELARVCSSKEASVRLTRIEGAVRPLWFVGLCLWLFLVIAFPLMAIWQGINLACLVGGAIALALSVSIAVIYRGSYRKVFAHEIGPSWADLIRFALYPVSATKAAEELAREAFPDLYPIAFGDKDIAKRELKRVWYWTTADALPSARHEWFYDCLRGEVETAIRRMGMEPEELIKPKQKSLESLSYCPRCESEYSFSTGACVDCVGVAVVAWKP